MTTQQVQRHIPAIGITLMIFACLSNACMATVVKKIALSYNVPNQILVFARFGVGFLIILPTFLLSQCRPLKKTLRIYQWQTFVIRIVFGLLVYYAYFYAIRYISLSSAVLLNYTAPLFIPWVLWVWRGVAITKKLWWGLVTGFMGVFLILAPAIGKLHIGYLIGLSAGLNGAIALVAARLQSYRHHPLSILFYYLLGCTLFSFLFCAKSFLTLLPSFEPKLWLYFALLGVFGTLFQAFLIFAVKWAQVRFLGAFMYLTVVFSIFIDWILFASPPKTAAIIGLFLVFLGAILMTLLDPNRQKIINNPSAHQ